MVHKDPNAYFSTDTVEIFIIIMIIFSKTIEYEYL